MVTAEDDDGGRRSNEARVIWIGREDSDEAAEIAEDAEASEEEVESAVAESEKDDSVMEASELDEDDLPGVVAVRNDFMAEREYAEGRERDDRDERRVWVTV